MRRRGSRVFRVRDGITLRLATLAGVHDVDPFAGRFARALRIAPGARVLDLGCGAGPYAVAAAARGAARVVATDIDPAAVACTLANAKRNGLSQVEGRIGSLFAPVRGERFDVIVTTLPQLPAPRPLVRTRWGGPDGRRLLRALAVRATAHLSPGGRLYTLVTDWAGAEAVAALLRSRGFRVRARVRVERAFQPVEYDRLQPGLFRYLDARARAGCGRYRRAGSWCYLGITFLEAICGDRSR